MNDDPAVLDQNADALPTPTISKEQIVAFARTASLEVTMPSDAEIDRMASLLPARTEVFLSDIPRRSAQDVVGTCARIAGAGLLPVPHFAVRRFDSAPSFERVLRDCATTGFARKAMLVAGDHDPPAGPFTDVAAALGEGTLKHWGIEAVAIAGYPEGHPRIATAALDEALAKKLALLKEQGLNRKIVSQFGFDHGALRDWLGGLRGGGVTVPLALGMAGPASATALAKFAMRCGVRTSMRGLMRGAGRIGRALTRQDCNSLIGPLAGLAGDAGNGLVTAHFFSFGGAVRTAEWIAAAQSGRFEIGDGGIEPHSPT